MKVPVQMKMVDSWALLPKYQSEGAAGFDFHSIEMAVIKAGETRIIGTGIALAIPQGYELQIRPRSGNSAKTKLRIANSPGTIDSDYRGEIKIICENIGEYSLTINRHDRIAQGVLSKVPQAEFELVEELTTTDRGDKGFGSSGV